MGTFPQKHVTYCVTCQDYIPDANVQAHMTANPSHAIIDIFLETLGSPTSGVDATGPDIAGFGNPNTLGLTGKIGQTYRDRTSGLFFRNTDGSTTWAVV